MSAKARRPEEAEVQQKGREKERTGISVVSIAIGDTTSSWRW